MLALDPGPHSGLVVEARHGGRALPQKLRRNVEEGAGSLFIESSPVWVCTHITGESGDARRAAMGDGVREGGEGHRVHRHA